MSTDPGQPEATPASAQAIPYPSPLRSLAILAGIIFMAEMVSMAILYYLNIQNYFGVSLLDGLMMMVLILPGLYFLQLKPLINHIAQRDRAESALRASESLLRQVLEKLPVGVWITDREGKIVQGNLASQEIWGGARYVGMNQYGEYKGWWAETGKQIKPEEWAAARAITKGEISLNEEVEIENFAGERKTILNSALPILDEQGLIQGSIIVNQDISLRRQAQKALVQTNELLERFFASISTSIAYMDRDFNFIRVNDTYAESAGHPPEYFSGKNHFEMYPHAENLAIFTQVVETGEPYSVLEKPFEYAEYPERGVTYWDWSLQPVKAADGTVEGVVLSLVDVTERKQAQIQLAQQNEELRQVSQAEHRQRELAEGLVQATIAVNSSLNLDQVLCSILEQIRKTIPFQGAGILLLEGNTLSVGSYLGFEDLPQDLPAVPGNMLLEDYPLIQQVSSTQQPVLVDHAPDYPGWRLFPGMEWIRSFLAAPLIIEGTVVGVINLLSDIPAAFSQEEAIQLLAFTAPAATALKNAQSYQAETNARQFAETLSLAAQDLTRSLDLEHVFDTLLDYIIQVVPSDTAGVTLLSDETSRTLHAQRSYGRWAEREPVPSLPEPDLTDSLLQRLISTRMSLTIPNTLDFQSGQEELPGAERIRTWLVVPIIASEKVIGTLEIGNTSPEPYAREQIQWAEALVSQAAVAIQNAWLFEQVRSSSERLQALARKLVEIQESERTTIARELHDEAGQALSSIKLSLGKIESDPDCPPHLRQLSLDLKAQADNVLEDLHRLAMYLRPVALDRLGLVAAVEQLAHNMQSDWLAIRCKAVGFTAERLPGDLESALYRIVQEAVTNILRHAQASTVGILLEKDQERVRVFVEDDGVGFDSDLLSQQDRLGMVGMRERAEMFGGALTVESAPGKGTSIIVEVPLGYPDSDR